jgi:hypothetical protein
MIPEFRYSNSKVRELSFHTLFHTPYNSGTFFLQWISQTKTLFPADFFWRFCTPDTPGISAPFAYLHLESYLAPLYEFEMTVIIVRKNTNEVAGVQLLLLKNFISVNHLPIKYLHPQIWR